MGIRVKLVGMKEEKLSALWTLLFFGVVVDDADAWGGNNELKVAGSFSSLLLRIELYKSSLADERFFDMNVNDEVVPVLLLPLL